MPFISTQECLVGVHRDQLVQRLRCAALVEAIQVGDPASIKQINHDRGSLPSKTGDILSERIDDRMTGKRQEFW